MRPTTADAVDATVRVMEQIQRHYTSGRGADEFVIEMLSNLRHFCDSHVLSFAGLDQRALDHYLTERRVRDGAKGTSARDPSARLRNREAAGDSGK